MNVSTCNQYDGYTWAEGDTTQQSNFMIWYGLPVGSPEPRSNISANIWAMKKFGTALEWS
jgi:hypothetical protein